VLKKVTWQLKKSLHSHLSLFLSTSSLDNIIFQPHRIWCIWITTLHIDQTFNGKLRRQNRGFKRERTFGHSVFLRARKAVRRLKAFPITSGLRYVPLTERIFQYSFPQTLPVESCNARPNLRTLYHEHARTAPEPK
jgi:hypothetical protein